MDKPTNDKGTISGSLTVLAIFCGLAIWLYSSRLTPEERAAQCTHALSEEQVTFARYQNLSMRFKQVYGREIEPSELLSPTNQLEHEISRAEGEWLIAKSAASNCEKGG